MKRGTRLVYLLFLGCFGFVCRFGYGSVHRLQFDSHKPYQAAAFDRSFGSDDQPVHAGREFYLA